MGEPNLFGWNEPETKRHDNLDQDAECWDTAIFLLKRSGMSDRQARAFYGKLLSQHRMPARDTLPALVACKESGTIETAAYLAKAVQRRTKPDPGLAVTWC